jgi:hypothetical protein
MSDHPGNSQLYVYGVVRARPEPRLPGEGIAGGPVRAIALDTLAALTSEVGEGPLEGGREELMTHARVLEEALEDGVVLPMRFGVVMPDEDTVRKQLLGDHRAELESQLDELEGKVELNVKAIYDEDVLMSEVVRQNRPIAELRESLRGQPEDATYYERIRLGEMVAEEVNAKREQDGQQLLARLEPLAVRVDLGDPIHERMALNASFLVERERIEAFDQAVDALGAEQSDRMRFKYTGPLPPHSFVELSMET